MKAGGAKTSKISKHYFTVADAVNLEHLREGGASQRRSVSPLSYTFCLQAAWGTLDKELFDKLYQSMPLKIKAFIKADGWHKTLDESWPHFPPFLSKL